MYYSMYLYSTVRLSPNYFTNMFNFVSSLNFSKLFLIQYVFLHILSLSLIGKSLPTMDCSQRDSICKSNKSKLK